MFAQTVDSTSRKSIDEAGKLAVLFYVSGTEYRLCAVHKPEEKEELTSYIVLDVKGHREEDWYRLEDVFQIKQIEEYAKKPFINGTTYDLIYAKV